ncbi:MAG: cytochrome b [bacterium]|nr:cytochrome b [bacterium]
MKSIYVWDLGVRLFHWSLVIAFFANDWFIDDDSDLHQYIGYFVIGLLTFRLLWGFIGSTYSRFSSFPISPQACLEQMQAIALQRDHIHVGHTPLGALMIYNLLLAISLIGLSGFMMTTDWLWGAEWIEEIHEALVVWAEVSIVLHVLAVIFESKLTSVNLSRAMITGVKEIPEHKA